MLVEYGIKAITGTKKKSCINKIDIATSFILIRFLKISNIICTTIAVEDKDKATLTNKDSMIEKLR
jgi:hypothetical protein